MIKRRLANAVDHLLQASQFGFRQRRCTSHALQFIRRIIDYGEANVRPCLILFLDWEKAFDRVSHSALLSALRRFNLPEHFVQVIASLYRGPEFYVEVEGKASDHFQQRRGIRQGCPLSPYLFLIVMSALLFMMCIIGPIFTWGRHCLIQFLMRSYLRTILLYLLLILRIYRSSSVR